MIPIFITLTTLAGQDIETEISGIQHYIDADRGGCYIHFKDGKTGLYKESLTDVRALINAQTQELLDQLAVTIRGH